MTAQIDSFEQIQCQGCLANDLHLNQDGLLECHTCGALHTVPGSFRGVGRAIKQKVARRAPKGFVVLWLAIAGPMFLIVPWMISAVFSFFGSLIFAGLGWEWLAQVAPICGIGCWPVIFIIVVVMLVVEAVQGSDKISEPTIDVTQTE